MFGFLKKKQEKIDVYTEEIIPFENIIELTYVDGGEFDRYSITYLDQDGNTVKPYLYRNMFSIIYSKDSAQAQLVVDKRNDVIDGLTLYLPIKSLL